MTEVRWDASVPREIRKAAEPIVLSALWLVPAWCWCLTLSYGNSADENSVATCEALYEYRIATITIHQAWLCEDDTARREGLVHEVCHILIAPLALFVDGIVDKLFVDHAGKQVLEEQNRVAVESVVQDIARAASVYSP